MAIHNGHVRLIIQNPDLISFSCNEDKNHTTGSAGRRILNVKIDPVQTF